MAVVSEPANAILTAIVVTRESFMNSGWSSFALMNLESRSGCLGVSGSVEGRSVGVVSFKEGKRSAMRALANRATGNVTSMKPYLERRRYRGFFWKIKSRIGICPIYDLGQMLGFTLRRKTYWCNIIEEIWYVIDDAIDISILLEKSMPLVICHFADDIESIEL